MKIGVDVVGVERFRELIERAPGFVDRFFTPAEIDHSRRAPDPILRLAGTFAAKEAVMKVSDLTPAPAWSRRIAIVRSPNGAPEAIVEGRALSISISHDGDVAIAVALGPPTAVSRQDLREP